MVTPLRGPRTMLAAALLTVFALLTATAATPAAAAPDPAGDTAETTAGTAGAGSTSTGDEGGNATLAEVLESANRGFLDAQTALGQSRARQATLATKVTEVEAELARLAPEVESIAAAAYRTGGLSAAAALLNSDSPDNFMDRATAINIIAARNDRQLQRLRGVQGELAKAKKAVDAEVATQEQQLAALTQRRQEAEKAISMVGGKATGGFVSASSPVAQPAPRKADGSLPAESCRVDDPTTTGCITGRTLHALQQARAAGFTRFVSCYRSGGPYEHPKGRACDFAAQPTNFGGDAVGGDRLYGNNLTAFLVRNADRLGVLYVIWYRQIWMPATGWRSYRGAGGDPSSDHTNHVHLSLY